MKDAQKPDHVSLTTLINYLREGRYVIPDFQREFEWKPGDIRDLARSIFLDYYIGSLLLWKGKAENFGALACEPIFGFEGKGDPVHIVLDGQQRLTAMYYMFIAPDSPLPNRSNRFLFFIRIDRFMEEAYDEAFEYYWTSRGENLLTDPESQFENHLFPISVVGKGGWELPNWVQDYEKHWRNKAEAASDLGDEEKYLDASERASDAKAFGEHLKGITEEYQVSYIELDRELEIDKICDIFTQINSRGIRLDIFDLVNAMLKPKGLQLKQMWRDTAPRLTFVETGRMNVYLLQVMSILCQAYCSPRYLYYLLPGQERKVRGPDGSLQREVLVSDVSDFEQRWNQAVDAVDNTIRMLRHPQEFGVISSKHLPYTSIIPAFAAIQETLKSVPVAHQLDAQRKFRHWYWASVFTNRYSGAVESTSARDYLDVKTWFEDDSATPALIDEFKERFRNLDLRRETRRGTSVYNGIFNLLVLNGARDWMTGNVPQYGDLDDHHIVPQSWGKGRDGVSGIIDTILNRTPLSEDTNRKVIRELLPNRYLPELIEASGEDRVRATLETHFISPTGLSILLRNPFGQDDFEEFLSERQRTIHSAIENLLVKERLDLAPHLRELDAKIEEIELSLRKDIGTTLNSAISLPPEHVTQKIDERMRHALKKNPGLDNGHYESLEGKLEYADLTDLKDIIMNKGLWNSFSNRYIHKEILQKRFVQLVDLRNGIRHSRDVDEITQKEGEAAIIWFEQIF